MFFEDFGELLGGVSLFRFVRGVSLRRCSFMIWGFLGVFLLDWFFFVGCSFWRFFREFGIFF